MSRCRCRSRATLVLAAAVLAAATGCSSSTPAHPSHATAGRAVNDVVVENARVGTAGWQLTRVGSAHEIEGWADRTSVLTGQPFGLHVSTTASSYTVHAVRIGWYGGRLGRQVWASPALTGVQQQPPRIVGSVHTVLTSWPVSTMVPTRGWPAGNYLLRLDASSGARRYVPIQLRRPSAAGSVVIVSADTTWQAYNAYGGYSLYHGPDGATASRARVVSFDRPYGTETGQGASEYMENMRPLVSLAEKLGLPVDYVSDLDLDRDLHLLNGARAVVLTGHDEYWSAAMRQALLDARTRGTNVAFMGANSGYRHIRFQPSSSGADRLEVCYKNPAEDPVTAANPSQATGQWRNPPDPRPESALTGAFYQSNPVKADLVVVDPHSWLLAGTGTHAGSVLPGLVAPEYDRVDLSVPTPRPIEVLSHSPLVVHGRRDFSDSAYYTVASGAGGFDAGSIAWINSLQGGNGPVATAYTTTVTTNLLTAFGAGPAARTHPAHDNVTAFYILEAQAAAGPAGRTVISR